MPWTYPDCYFEEVGEPTSEDQVTLVTSLPADPRLEPPLTGSLDHDMCQVRQSLVETEGRLRHFDHVVAGRLSGLRRVGEY